jgi:hypothetical protein
VALRWQNDTIAHQFYRSALISKDDVAITFAASDPGQAHFQYSTGERTVLGFSPLDYQARDPSPRLESQA